MLPYGTDRQSAADCPVCLEEGERCSVCVERHMQRVRILALNAMMNPTEARSRVSNRRGRKSH